MESAAAAGAKAALATAIDATAIRILRMMAPLRGQFFGTYPDRSLQDVRRYHAWADAHVW